MTERFAVIVDGAEWWGDLSLAPDGSPVRLEDPEVAARRREGAADEQGALRGALGALPERCLVIHGGKRGVGALAAAEASRLGLPMAVLPLDTREGEAAAVLLIGALLADGWKVKGISAGWSTVLDELRATIFVRSLQ